MKILIDTKALKDLRKIDKTQAKKIFYKIESLTDFPEVPNLKKLTNFQPPFRLRVGNYRVLFDVEDGILTIYNVKHRKESYT